MALAKRVKVKDGENLTDANIERVIDMLEQAKPITKREACEVLNISYNTTRLGNIIEQYKSRKAFEKRQRDANRGKPATDLEIQDVIRSYLSGTTIPDIAKELYRSPQFVRNIIEDIGVPQRGVGENYFSFSPLPEQCLADSFEVGETVWSARHQSPAIVDKDMGYTKDGEARLYRVYVLEKFETPEKLFLASWGKAGSYSTQPAYELGKLEHLRKYGVNIEGLN